MHMARIVVIDDEENIRFFVSEALTSSGYDVACASDGNKGLEIIDKFKPDIVITDILMPNKEGIETIPEIKQRHPEIKIIAMSGGGRIKGENYLKLAERLGTDATILKPFKIHNLLDIVAKLSS
jgi:DNA-binding NtrC family response regulator